MTKLLVIPNVWTVQQCNNWISQSESRGWEEAAVETEAGQTMAKHIRRNQKREDVDKELADALVPVWSELMKNHDPSINLSALFPIWRTYRYGVGDRFIRHRDGAKVMGGQKSSWTILIYLNADFEGGETVFYPETGSSASEPFVVTPAAGTLVLFDHRKWHAGVEVTDGTKFVLRTDGFAVLS